MPGPTEISAAELLRTIGAPDAPALFDVRIEEDFTADPRMIPGARRWPHRAILDLAPALWGRRAVIICQKGRKLSQGAAALLRTEGIAAKVLVGGMAGWTAADLPAIPAAAIPGPLWVSRERPGAAELASAWLIRRFVDADARFLFVAPGEIHAVAEKFGATPLAAEHSAKAHPFTDLLSRFGLETPPLRRLAAITSGAETGFAAEAPGFNALLSGLQQSLADDLRQLEAAMTLFDALNRWASDASEDACSWPGAGA